MNILNILGIIILITIGVNMASSIFNLCKAIFFEKKCKFKEACFYYAESFYWGRFTLLLTPFLYIICKKKIKNFSFKYGPFDYSDKINKFLKNCDPHATDDVAVLYRIIHIIEKFTKEE